MAFNLYKTLSSGLRIDDDARTVSVTERLSKSDYSKVKSVMNRLGGVWSTSGQHFTFRKSPAALVDRLLAFGSHNLNRHHFYPTKQDAFDIIAQHTNLSFLGASGNTVRVLEPTCGEGALISMLMAFGEQEGREFIIDGYDIDPINVMFCQEQEFNVMEADFLKLAPAPEYDLILMNPPFNGDEFIKHIRHAQAFLKPDGVLITITPTSWIANAGKNEAREWLLEQSQFNSADFLASGDYLDKSYFDGVSIKTTILQIDSASRTEARMADAGHVWASASAYWLYASNDPHTWDRIADIDATKLRSMAHSDCMREAMSIVTESLSRFTDDNIHIPRRYLQEYAQLVADEWLGSVPVARNPVFQQQSLVF